MLPQFTRTALLLTEDFLTSLSAKHVAIFGLGGVGGYVAEALIRSGIGKFDLIDHDKIALSNLNRQIIATRKTIGRDKAEVMKERMLDINPEADITVHSCFFLPENADDFSFETYDYVIDAIDTVTAKIELALRCEAAGTPLISSMGTGNKLNPALLEVTDIYKTSVCPLARVMRRELKKRGVRQLKVVYSREEPIKPAENADANQGEEGAEKRVPGSTAFVPSSAGLLIASEVIRDFMREQKNQAKQVKARAKDN